MGTHGLFGGYQKTLAEQIEHEHTVQKTQPESIEHRKRSLIMNKMTTAISEIQSQVTLQEW